jgi:ATP-dependent Clp protease adaptor protein ClpS
MNEHAEGSPVAAPVAEPKTRRTPRWHVVLFDDDDHTYDYVIEMLGKLFHISAERAYELACEVDVAGSVIVETTVLERAEFKRDQIHAYGRDWRLDYSRGSMRATLRAADAGSDA